jgi:tripeptide aminopeptidase
MTLTFVGFNTHPGYAKGQLVNAIKAAGDFLAQLPRDMSPERTDGYDGFVHPYVLQGGVEKASVRFIVRDFKTAALADKERLLEQLARDAAARHGARVEIKVEEQYRNMREVLDKHSHVVDYAREAIRRAGMEVRERPIRGGTDGSKLSFMGLPTPNIFAGEHNFHSRLEWVSVQDMEKAVEVIVNLARVWEERSR